MFNHLLRIRVATSLIAFILPFSGGADEFPEVSCLADFKMSIQPNDPTRRMQFDFFKTSDTLADLAAITRGDTTHIPSTRVKGFKRVHDLPSRQLDYSGYLFGGLLKVQGLKVELPESEEELKQKIQIELSFDGSPQIFKFNSECYYMDEGRRRRK